MAGVLQHPDSPPQWNYLQIPFPVWGTKKHEKLIDVNLTRTRNHYHSIQIKGRSKKDRLQDDLDHWARPNTQQPENITELAYWKSEHSARSKKYQQ